MSKGSFVDVNGRQIFYGWREDKPLLEADNTWVSLPKPVVPDDANYDFIWDGSDWIQADNDVTEVRKKVAARINIDAERVRSLFITPGFGQAMTYLEKKIQAEAVLADPNPQMSDYPLIATEVGIRGGDLAEVANLVKSTSDQWLQIGGAIEAKRQTAMVALEAAATISELEAVIVDWTDIETLAQ